MIEVKSREALMYVVRYVPIDRHYTTYGLSFTQLSRHQVWCFLDLTTFLNREK